MDQSCQQQVDALESDVRDLRDQTHSILNFDSCFGCLDVDSRLANLLDDIKQMIAKRCDAIEARLDALEDPHRIYD